MRGNRALLRPGWCGHQPHHRPHPLPGRARGPGYSVRGGSGWALRPVALVGADISRITGPIRSLSERVAQATGLGAVVDGCCGRGGHATEDLPDEDGERTKLVPWEIDFTRECWLD